MRVLLVDPSLFIAPYDSFLSEGIVASGIEAKWATRSLRPKEEAEIPAGSIAMLFYRFTERHRRKSGAFWKYAKGIEHAFDLRRLESAARQFDIVHFQFAVLPLLDLSCIRRLRRKMPVVLTVHDTTPFNGTVVNPLQHRRLEDVFQEVDHLIVLTNGAKETLTGRGVLPARISVIGHGPLSLRAMPVARERKSGRWRIVFFGRVQAYKGLNVLIEAIGLLPSAVRAQLEIVIAGEPFIDVIPLLNRIKELGLTEVLDVRFYRLSEEELADLLASADAFVFPYLQIDSSGAFFLALGFEKWIVASSIGAFKDVLDQQNDLGRLVTPSDPVALAQALSDCIGRRPEACAERSPSWSAIGAETAKLYEMLLDERRA